MTFRQVYGYRFIPYSSLQRPSYRTEGDPAPEPDFPETGLIEVRVAIPKGTTSDEFRRSIIHSLEHIERDVRANRAVVVARDRT